MGEERLGPLGMVVSDGCCKMDMAWVRRGLGPLGVVLSDGCPKMDMFWVGGAVRGPLGFLNVRVPETDIVQGLQFQLLQKEVLQLCQLTHFSFVQKKS